MPLKAAKGLVSREDGSTTMPAPQVISPRRSDPLAKALIARHEAMTSERSDLDALCDVLGRYILPTRIKYQDDNGRGLSRERMILDSTAPQALEVFSASLHGMMNNPASPWFDFTYAHDEQFDGAGDPVLPETHKRWAYFAARRCLRAMTSGDANVYSALHEAYIDLGLWGTACLFVERDPNMIGGVRIFHIDFRTIVVAESERGAVDFLIRTVPRMTPRKALQRWPETYLGRSIEQAQKDKTGQAMTKPVKFLHACFPATDQDLVRLIPAEFQPSRPGGWPYVSVWINAEDGLTVSVAGYSQFPFMVPRWIKVGGDVYGRSPAMTVIGDVLMVNRMSETILRGNEKIVDPPLAIPYGGLMSPVRLWPGSCTFVDGETKITPLIPPGASRIEMAEGLLERKQKAIRDGFYGPLFMTPDSPVKTATQVLQQTDERNRALSPMAFRLCGELYDPLLSRVFGIQVEDKTLPPPPDGLDLAKLTPRYLSPIAASSRQIEALSTTRLFETLQPWGQVDPGVFDWFSPDAIAPSLHAGSGAPPTILRSKAEVKEVRDNRRKQEEQQNLMASLPQAASALAATTSAQANMIKAQK